MTERLFDLAPGALIAIVLMAAVTFAIRASGLVLAERLPRSGFLADWLKAVPGAVLAALVAPGLVSGNLAEIGAAACVITAHVATRNLLVAMVAGVLGIVVLRNLLA